MSKRSTSEAWLDRGLAGASLAALGGQAVVGFGLPHAAWPAVIAGVVAAIAVRVESSVRPATTLVALLAVAVAGPWPWQVSMAVALGVWALLHPKAWAPRAPWGRLAPGWTAVVGGVTPIALLGWLALFHPDLSGVRAAVPAAPFAVLVLGGVGFAVINAVLEELVFRGVLQSSLEPAFGAGGAIVVQAVSFGVEHARGIPRGAVGVLLAGTWALMLGALRRRSGGLLAPVVAHVVADATIAVIVLGGR